jgi:ribosomal-protein-alanine N-acetyltransferase
VIRVAEAEDGPAIAALERDALGSDAWSEALVTEGAAGRVPTTLYLVATDETDDALVGYAATSIVDIAELQRIAVDPAHRRTGLASELLTAVVELARAGGADRLLLEVREDNAGAIAFYAARAFVEVDRRRRYYRDGTTAVVMRRGIGPSCG